MKLNIWILIWSDNMKRENIDASQIWISNSLFWARIVNYDANAHSFKTPLLKACTFHLCCSVKRNSMHKYLFGQKLVCTAKSGLNITVCSLDSMNLVFGFRWHPIASFFSQNLWFYTFKVCNFAHWEFHRLNYYTATAGGQQLGKISLICTFTNWVYAWSSNIFVYVNSVYLWWSHGRYVGSISIFECQISKRMLLSGFVIRSRVKSLQSWFFIPFSPGHLCCWNYLHQVTFKNTWFRILFPTQYVLTAPASTRWS